MWRSVTVLVISVLSVTANTIDAQTARVGRLPVLELLPAGVGSCRGGPVNAELQHDGIVRMISYTSSDSVSNRLVSVGMDAKGAPVMLMAMMGTEQGHRGETESVNVSFGPTGVVVRGRRGAFTTGIPARVADDRQLALLPADTVRARRLAAAVRQRCGT